MGYLDSSSLEEATAGLIPPTLEDFMASVGDPILSFTLTDSVIDIPKGVLTCCRVSHQPHCRDHVAGSLLGCFYGIQLPDGTVQERRPEKKSFDGDILAYPNYLSAAVQIVALMAKATAEAQGGTITEISFDVWLFNLEQAESWRYLSQQMERERDAELASLNETPSEVIQALDITVLPLSQCSPEELAKLMARPGFHPAVGYADRVELLPHEVGHDDTARYVTDPVWGEEGVVPPVADALTMSQYEAEPAEETPCPDLAAT